VLIPTYAITEMSTIISLDIATNSERS